MTTHRLTSCSGNRRRWLSTALLLVLAGSPARALDGACAAGPFRDFDFWLGEWRVTLADGREAGRNVIVSQQEGCVLVEQWQGVKGATGTSMNVYDPVTGRWRQLWVSPGTLIDIVGDAGDGRMVLEGTITYLAEARAYPFRGTWSRLDDGRVRQHFEQASADGAWSTWFEGFYAPLAD